MTTRRLAVLPVLLSVALALALAAPAAATPSGDRRVLQGYAADTWRSFELLLDPTTGLPSDNVSAAGVRSRFTSPTNVGAYLWSTLAARDAGIISPSEARQRIAATLASVARLERHQPSGMFYNWYDPATGAKLTTWPVDGSPVYPFLSSVDNGWMAAALLMVSNAVPQLRDQARALLAPMDFGYYYDPAAGLLRGGFWVDPPGTAVHHRRQLPRRRPRRALHLPPLRRAQHRAAHRQLPWHRLRPGPGQPLLHDVRAPSRRPATGAGRSSSRRASPGPTWASRCSRATTATAAWTSCPAGAGACSRP